MPTSAVTALFSILFLAALAVLLISLGILINRWKWTFAAYLLAVPFAAGIILAGIAVGVLFISVVAGPEWLRLAVFQLLGFVALIALGLGLGYRVWRWRPTQRQQQERLDERSPHILTWTDRLHPLALRALDIIAFCLVLPFVLMLVIFIGDRIANEPIGPDLEKFLDPDLPGASFGHDRPHPHGRGLADLALAAIESGASCGSALPVSGTPCAVGTGFFGRLSCCTGRIRGGYYRRL